MGKSYEDLLLEENWRKAHPWRGYVTKDWYIVGMNEYRMDGKLYLYVALKRDGDDACIVDNHLMDGNVWTRIHAKIREKEQNHRSGNQYLTQLLGAAYEQMQGAGIEVATLDASPLHKKITFLQEEIERLRGVVKELRK